MAVYVDDNRHLFADTRAELHEMVRAVGIPELAYHEGRIPHYTISTQHRGVAIARGAMQVDQQYLRDWLKRKRAIRKVRKGCTT